MVYRFIRQQDITLTNVDLSLMEGTGTRSLAINAS